MKGRSFTRAIVVISAVLSALTLSGFAAGASGAATPRLDVKPRVVGVGERTCFKFTARLAGRPLRGKVVSFEGRRLRTSPRGRAVFCGRMRWTGRHGALLQIKGHRNEWAMVRARPTGGLKSVGGSWHKFVVNIPAWGDTGGCDVVGPWASHGWHYCTARATGVGTDPFSEGRSVTFGWTTTYISMLNSYTYYEYDGKVKMVGTNRINGTTPSANSGAYYIADGGFPEIGVKSGIVSGTDPAKEGVEGGPLHMNVVYHDPFLGRSGFNFYVAGYLFY